MQDLGDLFCIEYGFSLLVLYLYKFVPQWFVLPGKENVKQQACFDPAFEGLNSHSTVLILFK